MQKNHKILAFLAFAMYFLTGASCIVVGSSLPQLVQMYGIPLSRVVLLGSAYALGRVLTVYLTGWMVEKVGALKVLAVGTLLIASFLFGVPTFVNYYAGLMFAFLGGVGMGAQDTVCPVLLSIAYKEQYAASLSAGQALFGLGNFATPFLVGLFLTGKLPFYYSYYVLLIVPAVMLICIPFGRLEPAGESGGSGEPVQPLYTKKLALAYGAIVVESAAYSAVVNTITMYTSSFAESMGISASSSAFMLTTYNVGCFVGSTVFILILRKVAPQTVLLVNNVIALVVLAVMLLVNRVPVYFVCLAVSGFFLGVLFSVIVTIATRIDYKHISRGGSVIATAGGASDSLTPVITGFLVGLCGVGISYKYAILMIVISIGAALILLRCTTEKEEM